MKIEDIKKIDFWAREFKLPLFWLTGKKRSLVEDDSICFYKNSALHLYFLNNRVEEEVRSGYRYFSKKGGFENYIKLAEQMIKKLRKVILQYKDIKTKELNDSDLYKLFDKFINVLDEYSRFYKLTEDTKLRKFENIKDKKLKTKLNEIGRVRFKLRKEGEPIFYILMGKLLKEIAKRTGVTVNDLFFYDDNELHLLYKGKKLSNSVLLSRKKGYALWIMDGKMEMLTGQRFKKMWKWVNSRFKVLEQGKIKGVVANKGMAKGTVRLILHTKRNISKDVSKFKKGEVLVTEMTRPATILACRKAAAIVTDEGGVICHAAIISRELNIPCIVGANIATQVLKDGDEVEVDANEGIVRIF